jgi:DNA-binding CsgD family transcriptional regulator
MSTAVSLNIRMNIRAESAGSSVARRTEAGVVSSAEMARQCRIMAGEIDAVEFAVFRIGPSRERSRLVPWLDSEFPNASLTAKLLSSRFGGDLVRHAVLSTAPLWWSANPDSLSATAFRGLRWGVEIAPCLPGTSGLCLPVQTEGRQQALFVFLGPSIALEEQSLCDLHARCFALFGTIARFRSTEGGKVPSISKRELECLKLTANGHTSEDIAARLGLSIHTANQYLTNATQKLNVVNRMHAVAKALRLGLID